MSLFSTHAYRSQVTRFQDLKKEANKKNLDRRKERAKGGVKQKESSGENEGS
jgi:hypothetical protein